MGHLVVKAQDLQFWEFSVVLGSSLCDHAKDLSPCPTWDVDISSACFMCMGMVSCCIAILCPNWS